MIPFDQLKANSALLFGDEVGNMKEHHHYSFAWHGATPQEDWIKTFFTLVDDIKDINQLFDHLDNGQLVHKKLISLPLMHFLLSDKLLAQIERLLYFLHFLC